MSLRARWLRVVLAAALVSAFSGLCAGGRAGAHPAPGSALFLDFTVDGARIEQDVPLEELELALHMRLGREGESAPDVVERHRELLRAYAGAHVRVVSERSGLPWRVDVVEVRGHAAEDGPRASFRFVARAPDGEASTSIRLVDDLVMHEIGSHYVTAHVRSDWWAGSAGLDDGSARLVGTLRAGRSGLVVTRDGSFWRGLRGAVGLGMEHIAAGTDHVLFLFALVLVAPVAAASPAAAAAAPVGRPRWQLRWRARWESRRTTSDTLRELSCVVTAFTAGHSATLALGVLGGVELPPAVVEPAIAASIFVTALHAWRPVFPRREALVAGAFGLVHGLAFASALAHRDLGRAQAAWTLLGFNVGVELAQVGLLFLVVPWVLILGRTRVYDGFRIGGAGVAAVLAAAWFVERTVGVESPTAGLVEWLSKHPTVLLATLASSAVVARAVERRRGSG